MPEIVVGDDVGVVSMSNSMPYDLLWPRLRASPDAVTRLSNELTLVDGRLNRGKFKKHQ